MLRTFYIKDFSHYCYNYYNRYMYDLFLLNYIVINKVCSIKPLYKFIDSATDFSDKHIVTIWMVTAFVSKKHNVPKSKNVISKVLNKVYGDKSSYTICQILLKMGFDADGAHAFGPFEKRLLAPIFIAIERGHKDIIRLLIYHCCDLEQCKGMNLETPADFASRMGCFDILQVLFLCGAKGPRVQFRYPILKAETRFQEDRLWLINWLRQPHSLKYFCRVTVRREYGKRLLAFIKTINYPTYLKDYITTKVLI